jgi:hypothetical protein
MRVVATAIGLSIALSGCSLLSARAPAPNRAAGEPTSCNPGKGAAGLDGTMAAGLGVASLVALGNDEGTTGLITGLLAVAYGFSAGHGVKSADACRRAMAEASDWYEDGRGGDASEPPAPAAPEAPPTSTPAPAIPTPAEAAEAAAVGPPRPDPDPEPEPEPVPDAEWPDFWAEGSP